MAVIKIIELVGSSTDSSDARRAGRAQRREADACATSRPSTWCRPASEATTSTEWRAHVRVAFLIERVNE